MYVDIFIFFKVSRMFNHIRDSPSWLFQGAMDKDSSGEGAEAGSKMTGDAVAVDQAVAGYGKKQILAGLSLRVPINKYF